jgi:hypothetical protein
MRKDSTMTLLSRSRTAAIIAAMGVSFVATPLLAQPAPAAKPPAAAAATSSKPETVEQRIKVLHDQLQIKPEQEKKWADVAQAMRENAQAMDKLVAKTKSTPDDKMTAVDDLKTYRDFAQAHVDGLKNLISAFDDLYASMPDAQKRVADAAFQKYGRNQQAQQQ